MAHDGKHRVRWDLPDLVAESIARIEAAGGVVYVVGGSVRDPLLGRPVTDWDLATSLVPDRMRAVLPPLADFDPELGTVLLSRAWPNVVITTMRAEGDYGPNRRPGWVRFTDDPEVDAQRRDFTVNAIYADPHSGAMTDPVAGLADLEARLLRVVGPAEARLREDPLRLLRAVRLSVSCRLQLEPGTAAAIASAADAARALSAERVFSELGWTFTGVGRGRGLELMFETGLAAVVLHEAAALGPEQRATTRRVLDAVPEGDPVLAWSAVLCELGGAAEAVLRRLHAPRVLRDSVGEVCQDCERFAEILDLAPEERAHWLRSARLSAHLELHRARQIALGGDSAASDEFERAVTELAARCRAHVIDGRDVLSLGVPPGPMVGKILAEAVAELDKTRNPTRDVAIEALRRIVSRYVKDAPPPVDKR